MRITIDVDSGTSAIASTPAVPDPVTTTSSEAPNQGGTAVDAGACADPTAAAFLAAASAATHDRNSATSAGAAPDL